MRAAIGVTKLMPTAVFILAALLGFMSGRWMQPRPSEHRDQPAAETGGADGKSDQPARRLSAITARRSGFKASQNLTRPHPQPSSPRRSHADAAALGQEFADALRVTDPQRRQDEIARLLQELDAGNVTAALEAFEEGPRGDEYEAPFHAFLHAWGRIDSASAISYLLDR